MVGTQIGSYQILGLLGEGGMGSVFLAEHVDLKRRVALKVVHGHLLGKPNIVARFLNEARASAAMEHPAFVTVFEWGRTAEDAPYLVMELLKGQSLDRRIDEGALPVAEALRLAESAAEALSVAHALGTVHRDLKPANLFLVEDAARGEPRLKILDFGIAKLSAELAVEGTNTRTGQLLGTPTYMSPEQCLGRKDVDRRSDIYSLGAVLFEMLCARPPFAGGGLGDLINAHINTPAPRPSALRPGLPPRVDEVVGRTLAKAPADRYQSMDELRHELTAARAATLKYDVPATTAARAPASRRVPEAFLATSQATVPPVSVERTVVTPKRRTGLASLLVVGVAVAIAVPLLRGRGAPTAPPSIPAAPATPSAPVAPPAAPVPLPPLAIKVRLRTEPPGAWVRDVATGDSLGATPLVLERAPEQELVVRVGVDGFQPVERTVRFAHDHDEDVTLDRVSPERRPAPKRPRRADPDDEPRKL